MNRSDVVAQVAHRLDMHIDEVEAFLDTFVDVLADSFQREESVTIRRFGKFVVRRRVAAVKPNPMTGDLMHIPDRIGVAFVASDILRDAINGVKV